MNPPVMNQRADPADLYAVLGVTPTATPTEIAHAFRVKLRALHPDTHYAGSPADAEIQLRQVLAAYARLRDPQRRAIYDQNHPAHIDTATTQVTVTHHRNPPANRSALWIGPVRWQR